MKDEWSEYLERPETPAEGRLYKHLSEQAQNGHPADAVTLFQQLFIEQKDYPYPNIVADLEWIVQASFAEQEFKYILNRSCYIYINSWWGNRNGQAFIPELIGVFEKIPDSTPKTLAGQRLQYLIKKFLTTSQYRALQRLTLAIKSDWEFTENQETEKPLDTIIQHYPYIYEYNILTRDSSLEQRRMVQSMRHEAQQRLEEKLQQYIDYSKLNGNNDEEAKTVKNPTLLSNTQLDQALQQFTNKIDGNNTLQDLAEQFLQLSQQTHSYKDFKQQLYNYLIPALGIRFGKQHFNQRLARHLQEMLKQFDDQPVSEALLSETCRSLINFLVVDSPQHPNHTNFIDLIGNIGATRTVALLLKVILLHKQSKSWLEKRFSILFNHYAPRPKQDVVWLIEVLENVNVAFITNFGTLSNNLISSKDIRSDIRLSQTGSESDISNLNLASGVNVRRHLELLELGNIALEEGDLEKAIENFQEIIETSPQEKSDEWAEAQLRLADVYMKRMQGDRSQNIELSIQSYQRALEVFTFEDRPQAWAEVQCSLGSAYFKRKQGNRSQNIERSIRAYQQALEVLSHDKEIKKWAEARYNLGCSYISRTHGYRDSNIKTALHYFQNSLQIVIQDISDSKEVFDRVLPYIDAYVEYGTGKPLSEVQKFMLQGAWLDRSYDEMGAYGPGYNPGYLRQDVGPSLWNLLSKVLGEKVGKKSFRLVTLRWIRTEKKFSSSKDNDAQKREDFDVILEQLDARIQNITGKHLSEAQCIVLRGAWFDLTYDQMGSDGAGYSPTYLRQDVGPGLWQLVSNAIGEKVGKKSFRFAATQWIDREKEEFDAILEQLDARIQNITGKHLSEVQILVLRGAWFDLTYDQMGSDGAGYGSAYLRQDVGPSLWKTLSQVLGERVGKKTFRLAIRRWMRQQRARTTHNLPSTASIFVGRSRELELLNQLLQKAHVAVVNGPAGIGKTELCKKFAWTNLSKFTGGVFWLNAHARDVSSGRATFNIGQVNLDNSLSGKKYLNSLSLLSVFSDDKKTSVDQTINHLSPGRIRFQGTYWPAISAYKENLQPGDDVFVIGRQSITLLVASEKYWKWDIWPAGDILIVLDDVSQYKQVKPYIPPKSSSKFKVLVTTRQNLEELGFLRRLIQGSLVEDQIITLSGLTDEESIFLLKRYLSGERIDHELGHAKEICEWLQFMPLSLRLVAEYLQQSPDISLENALLQLRRENIGSETLISLRATETVQEITSNLFTEEAASYSISIFLQQETVRLGEELEIVVCLSPAITDESNAHIIEVPRYELNGDDLNILLAAPGFRIDGDSVASLPLDSSLHSQQSEQRVSFRLVALQPGRATLTVELYRGDTFAEKLETEVDVISIDTAIPPQQRIQGQPRPVPQPDLILQVQSVWNAMHSACRLRYQLNSIRLSSLFSGGAISYSEELSSSWLERLQGHIYTVLEGISKSPSSDTLLPLTALGKHLFQTLLPDDLQTDFRSLLNANRPLSMLVLADQKSLIPWELLHTGQQFLSEQLIFGHWFWELNDQRTYEFPVGAISLSHYASVEQPELWQQLLAPPGAPPPLLLSDGVFNDLNTTETMRGLHLLRYSQSPHASTREDAPVPLGETPNENQTVDQQLRPAKLNLRRNRPLVSLGYISSGHPELTTVEETWAPAFLRAGSSAFIGSRWAVNTAVEATFSSNFYHRLWMGDSLGVAFQNARSLTRTAVPDSCDWLAYVLYGDPMARPYRPVEGKGYAVVEPIGRDIEDPLPTNSPARFRLSLRRTPPVWHEERVIEVAENLAFENLQVHVLTFGLDVTPTPVEMTRTPKGNYLGWFTLTAPPEAEGKSIPVQVHFMDGIVPIHSLTFSMTVAAQAIEEQGGDV